MIESMFRNLSYHKLRFFVVLISAHNFSSQSQLAKRQPLFGSTDLGPGHDIVHLGTKQKRYESGWQLDEI